jgi:hypothetical protein
MAVVLRDIRLYKGSYKECADERLFPVRRAKFIRPRRHPKLKRFRVTLLEPIEEDRNRYGVPRFDPKRDVYLPK